MYKSYTIKASKFKEISNGRGTISYFLVDELGEKRTVTAKAKCGFIKRIKSIEAIHHRETPLVEALASASVNDTIVIDFSDFNKKYPRLHSNSSAERMARGTLKTLNSGQNISSLDALNIDIFRLLQLFLIASLIFMVIMIGMDVFQ